MIDLLGWSHLAAAAAGLGFGAAVLVTKKGTTGHRRLGWAYVISMVLVNGTAFLIYDLFGRFGPFHYAAMFSLATVLVGLVPAVRRKPRGRWIRHHAYWMTGSYVGLLAAATAETATRYLAFDFGMTVVSASGVVSVLGVWIILSRVPVALKNLGRPRSVRPTSSSTGSRS